MSNNSFSIIVPTYNTYEKYLRECLDSLISIQYSNFEIIIVDDGSNDATKDILEQYNHFSFLRIIHQSNGGISKARQTGINNSTKEYICFVDSDDIVKHDFLDILNEIVTNYRPDFILHSSPRFVDDITKAKEENHLFDEGIVKKEDMIKQIVSLHMNSVGNVCAKKELYLDMYKYIDLSIINGEDLQQTSYLASISNVFYYTKQPLDYYRFNEKERGYYDVTKIDEVNFIVPTYNIFFKDNSTYSHLLPTYKTYAINAVLYIAFQICWLKNIDIKKHLDELNKQNAIKILKSIKQKGSFSSEFVFSLLINKKYFLLKTVSSVFKLFY